VDRQAAVQQFGCGSEADLLDRWDKGATPVVERARMTKIRERSRILPVAGEVLPVCMGSSVEVFEDWKDNHGKPFRSLLCYAKVDDSGERWVLHSERRGLVCFVVSRCHQQVVNMRVRGLRALKLSKSKRSVVCEVVE
jgi:hypothetical protein